MREEILINGNAALKEKMTSAPRSPGVYIMRDAQGKVIYVGKANDLRSRISSYFTGRDTRPMAPFLMTRVSDIDFITTATEKEALILENNLIKKHRPRYNVILRDDKTYYHLSLDPTENIRACNWCEKDKIMRRSTSVRIPPDWRPKKRCDSFNRYSRCGPAATGIFN